MLISCRPASFAAVSAYRAAVIADGAVGYWRLGESSGTVAVDEIGAAHNGTYTNNPTLGVAGLISGDADTAVSFITDDYVVVTNNTTIDLTSNFSLEAWFKTTNSGQNVIVLGTFNSVYNLGHGIAITNSTLRVCYDTGASATGALPQIHDGNKHHVVVTYGGVSPTVEPKIYLDGVLQLTVAADKTISSQGTLHIGANLNLSGFFDGTLDECAIYNSVLDLTKIQNHYNLGA